MSTLTLMPPGTVDEATAKAPDKEKLIALAAQLRAMKSPHFETAQAMAVIQEFSDRLLSLAEYIEEEASKL